MRKLSANYIYPISSPPIKNGIIIADDNGKILEIKQNNESTEEEGVEFYNGILVPGFVNTHCHLELSWTKDLIKPNEGLPAFIKNIIHLKKQTLPNDYIFQIADADKQMERSGIVVVGDTHNGHDSFSVKSGSALHYVNFFELTGTSTKDANAIFNHALFQMNEIENKYAIKLIPTPHAAYSVSEKLLQLITIYNSKKELPFSIHNQESIEENEYFINHKGKLKEIFDELQIDQHGFEPKKTSSLTYLLNYIKNLSGLLVHNTFTSEEEIKKAISLNKKLYWAININSNLYIENKLPPLNDLIKNNANITIGTDSLASNKCLCILEEMKSITKHFPTIHFTNIIEWGTLNGAKALQIDKIYGSIEKGKKPGINLIQYFDFEKSCLTNKSCVKRLM
jgi:aminodeoxyfutalosine deaminase